MAYVVTGINILNSLFDDKSSSTSNSTTSGSFSGESRASQNSKVELMDKKSKKILDSLTGNLGTKVDTAKEFDRAGAVAQTEGVVKSIFDTYQKTALPEIANMGNRGGSYDNTTHQLLANDAFAQAVNKSSATVLETVFKEQQAKTERDQFDVNALMGALGLQAQATQKSSSKSKEKSWGESTSEASGTTSSTSDGLLSKLGF